MAPTGSKEEEPPISETSTQEFIQVSFALEHNHSKTLTFHEVQVKKEELVKNLKQEFSSLFGSAPNQEWTHKHTLLSNNSSLEDQKIKIGSVIVIRVKEPISDSDDKDTVSIM